MWENQEFGFIHVKFEVPIKHPSGNIQQLVGQISLDIRRGLDWRNKFENHEHVDNFKDMRLDEITVVNNSNIIPHDIALLKSPHLECGWNL